MSYLAINLDVQDIGASMRFYCDALGFSEWFRWEQAGQVAAGGVQRGEGRIIFDTTAGLSPEQVAGRGIGVNLYFVLDDAEDINAIWAGIQGKAPVVTPIGDRPWGDRTFTVSDPDGFRVTIAQTIRQG